MSHAADPDREYRFLQQQLDRRVTGAPESPVFMQILKLLYKPEEVGIARRIPGQFTPSAVLAEKLDKDEEALTDQLTEMARRGVIVDVEHNGQRYFSLPPVVIGFFELTFMRARPDMPMGELAHLFDAYMTEDDRFARAVFGGRTQIGRSLVREEALPLEPRTEILDWERSSHIIQSASSIAVGICQCRHKASHLGKVCERPQRTCLSLNWAAESLIRSGIAEEVKINEAMRILEESKEAGLAQTGDNVQRQVTYICNCCVCCCGMMHAIRRFDINNAIVTSNWIMEVDLANCNGCGLCIKACPVEAIRLAEERVNGKRRRWVIRDENLCLGCGTCYGSCKFNAINMVSRPQRVFTPETIFDLQVAMAIERGKLADLLFEEREQLSHRALGRVIAVIEKSPPFKAAMAIKPLKSAFLTAVVAGAKQQAGDLIEVLT